MKHLLSPWGADSWWRWALTTCHGSIDRDYWTHPGGLGAASHSRRHPSWCWDTRKLGSKMCSSIAKRTWVCNSNLGTSCSSALFRCDMGIPECKNKARKLCFTACTLSSANGESGRVLTRVRCFYVLEKSLRSPCEGWIQWKTERLLWALEWYWVEHTFMNPCLLLSAGLINW